MNDIPSPVSWLGGKHPMLPHLLPMIPSHTCYVELFGGGGWLLFAKNKSKSEIYNDINSDLVAFFRIIRDRHTDPDRFEQFVEYCYWTPNARDSFDECKHWQDEPDQIKRVAKWWMNIRMSYGSLQHTTTWAISTTQTAGRIKRHIENFNTVADRLREVHIENKPWNELLGRYDRPEVFFYLDPPYLPSTRLGLKYEHEMSEEDHENFIERLKETKAKVLLSGYPSELYDSLCTDAGWNTEKIKKKKNIAGLLSGNVNDEAIEGLWYNFEYGGQQDLF